MTEKTIERVYASTIKKYIAKDGKEFDNRDKCIDYESELDLNNYADKYKIKFIEVPTFINDDYNPHGISFYFPQDGNKDELKRLLTIYQNYVISKNGEKWRIHSDRNLSNVSDSDFEIRIPSLNKGDNYIFYFSWKEYDDEYDYFYNQIVSREKAIAKLKEEIKSFEEIFETKF